MFVICLHPEVALSFLQILDQQDMYVHVCQDRFLINRHMHGTSASSIYLLKAHEMMQIIIAKLRNTNLLNI
jgi:hypothetical protein